MLFAATTILGGMQAHAQLADLAPLTLTPLQSITAGQTVYFQSAVTNQGAGPVNADITDRVTLSTTPSTNGAIVHVDFDNGVNIGGNSSYASFDPYRQFSFLVPANVLPGTNYYLVYEVDIDNAVAESNETNNTLVQPVHVVIPDLVPLTLTPLQLISPGQTVHFQSTVTNQGAGFINSDITDRVTLSTTPSISGAIVQIEFDNDVNIGGNSSYTSFDPYSVFEIHVPGNLSPGNNYYLIYEVDVDNTVAESNENNNTLVEQVQVVIPDLAPSTLTPLQPITAGQTVHFQSTVTNQGAGPVNADITDRVTLSTTPSTSGAIAQVVFDNDVNIGGNSSYASFDPYGVFDIQVPSTLVPGTNYYLIYEVDVDNAVAESNENNNTLVQQVSVVIPDLVPLKLTQEQLLTAGQTIYFQTLATNQGAGVINDTVTERVTLSTTPSTNGAIIHVDFNDNVTIGGNSSYTSFDPYGDFKILVPGNLPPGTNYYFIYETDVSNQVTESNETNNTLVQAAQLSIPDLAPLTLTPLAPLTEGLPVYFRSTVTNQGAGFINGTVTDRVTLSTTPSTNGAVASVDFGNSININGNSSYTSFDPYSQFSLIVPANLPPGTNYYLIYQVNVGSPQVAESNTNNNTLVVETSVGIGDLVAVRLSANSQPIAGFPLSVSYTITNSGSTLTGTWDDRLTLSTLPTINGAITNWPLDDSHSLPNGGAYTGTRTIVLPQVATNIYYLILQTDAENVIPESNENNNVVSERISVIEQPAIISLLTPTNQIAKETCVPVLCTFSAAAQMGSYTITNITFFDGAEVIGQTTNVSDPTLSAVLDVGVHNITVKATDIFTNQITSTNLAVLTLYYPTNLNVLRADLDLKTNFVGCMCALAGSNYAVLTTTNLGGFPAWQTNIVITHLTTNMLFFTNKPTDPQRYYRAQLQH